jgi:hypothetical protein
VQTTARASFRASTPAEPIRRDDRRGGHVEVIRIDLVEILLCWRGRHDPVREQRQPTTLSQDRRDLLQRKPGIDPLEGLGENDEIELSIRGPPLLEARLLDADTLRGRQARHPLVRLDGQHVRPASSSWAAAIPVPAPTSRARIPGRAMRPATSGRG